MSKRYVQVPIAYLEPIFEEWKSTFDKGHFVNVFFVPYGDLLFRAMQFADWMSEKHGQAVRLINFETELIVNPENLEEVLDKYKEEKLILLAKRGFMRPDAVTMAGVLEKWYAKEGRGALIMHEGFPAEIAQYVPRPVMTQCQMVQSLYPKDASREYVRTTAILFGVEIADEIVERIISYCGGIPWLINDVLRRVGDDNLFKHENLIWKVEQIAKSIPNIPGIEKDLLAYGLKSEKNEWLPVFRDYFANHAKNKLSISDREVIFDGRDYTTIFSPGERRILTYLRSSKEVVNRDELGRLFWQEMSEAEYSDWALDAIMSRLRKKISKIGIPLVIRTRRGRGYECL